MSGSKIKKIIIGALVFGQAAAVPFFAFASLNPVPTNDSGDTINNTAFNIAFKPFSTSYQTCLLAEQAFDVTDSALQAGASGIAGISGGNAMALALGKEVLQYNTFIKCAEAAVQGVQLIPSLNLYTDNQRLSFINQAKVTIANYQSKLAQANARLANEQQGIWKTLVFNILIQTSKSIADALVTKLVNNYKIANVKQYADSVATLMYDNQYIRDNFPDAQGQLMARAILNQPQLRNQIHPGIFVAANEALGFAPTSLTTNDPNFYQKLAMVGSSSANPYYLQTSYNSKVDQAHSQALFQANAQIAQSQGYKTPVNCAGSLTQQRQIDAQAKAASDQLANRQALLVSLQNGGSKVNQSDLAKAQADYNSALIAWNNIPFAATGSSSVSSIQQGGGNNLEGTMAITMCEAISSPANLINKGIDQAFNAVGVNMAQYNNNNLPGFITLISQVASQIGSSLIFGGASGAKGALLANEGVLASAGVTAVNQSLASNAANANGTSVTFVIAPNPGASTPNTYSVNWDATSVSGADHVSILGNGLPSGSQSLPASGATSIATTNSSNYTLTVYDSSNSVLTSRSLTLNTGGPSSAPTTVSGGSLVIYPSTGGTVSAGSNVTIACSSLTGLPSGAYVVIVVNNSQINQTAAINNGQCSANVPVTKANNFTTGANNIINAWISDSSGDQITSAPDITANLSVSGNVLGAFTNIPVLQTRGPVIRLLLRGE